jgi:hypothetical protein
MEEVEVGGACGAYSGEKKCIKNFFFWWKDMKYGVSLEDLSLDERITLKLILKKWDGSRGLSYLALNRDQ